MTFLDENDIEGLFYEELVTAVDSVPVKAVPVEKIDELPVVVLQWITSGKTDGWGGHGGIVRKLTVGYSLTVIGQDRNTVNSVVSDIENNLLLRGQIVVDAATSMQLVYIRPNDWEYKTRDDDVIERISVGTLVYIF